MMSYMMILGLEECLPFDVIIDEGGHGTYLNGVGIIRRVFEETVVWIEQIPR